MKGKGGGGVRSFKRSGRSFNALKGFQGKMAERVEFVGDIPGGNQGAAGTPGSLSRCPAPVPSCCMCPKRAPAPRVPKKRETQD